MAVLGNPSASIYRAILETSSTAGSRMVAFFCAFIDQLISQFFPFCQGKFFGRNNLTGSLGSQLLKFLFGNYDVFFIFNSKCILPHIMGLISMFLKFTKSRQFYYYKKHPYKG